MAKDDFLHALIRDLTDVLYEEHGTGVQYRTTLVGVDYFEKKYGNTLRKTTSHETIDAVIDALKTEGVISSAEYKEDGVTLHATFHSCRLYQIDEELQPLHGKIVNCPCANIVMHFLDSVLGKYSELAKIELDKSGCRVMMCVMGKSLD